MNKATLLAMRMAEIRRRLPEGTVVSDEEAENELARHLKNDEKALSSIEGKTVSRLLVSNDQSWLKFEFADAEPVYFFAEGDCCSTSWFSDVTGFDALPGGYVLSTKSISMPNYNVDDGRCRDEFDEVYGFLIKTHKGDCVLAFRNSSNGFYGGTLVGWGAETAGWLEPKPGEERFVEIVDDWSA